MCARARMHSCTQTCACTCLCCVYFVLSVCLYVCISLFVYVQYVHIVAKPFKGLSLELIDTAFKIEFGILLIKPKVGKCVLNKCFLSAMRYNHETFYSRTLGNAAAPIQIVFYIQ